VPTNTNPNVEIRLPSGETKVVDIVNLENPLGGEIISNLKEGKVVRARYLFDKFGNPTNLALEEGYIDVDIYFENGKLSLSVANVINWMPAKQRTLNLMLKLKGVLRSYQGMARNLCLPEFNVYLAEVRNTDLKTFFIDMGFKPVTDYSILPTPFQDMNHQFGADFYLRTYNVNEPIFR